VKERNEFMVSLQFTKVYFLIRDPSKSESQLLSWVDALLCDAGG
jgi:hypothetical protein